MKHRVDTHSNRVHPATQLMDMCSCHGSGDPLRYAGRRRNFAVKGHPRFQYDEGPAGLYPMAIGLIEFRRLLFETPDVNDNPRPSELPNTTPRHQGIGIAHRHDDAMHAGINNRWHAGRRAFLRMATGFQCDVEGRATSTGPGSLQCHDFGMRPAGLRMIPAPNDVPPGHDHRTDHGIRAGRPLSSSPECKGLFHETDVWLDVLHRRERVLRDCTLTFGLDTVDATGRTEEDLDDTRPAVRVGNAAFRSASAFNVA